MKQRNVMAACLVTATFLGGATLAQAQHEHGSTDNSAATGEMQGTDDMMEMHRMMMGMHQMMMGMHQEMMGDDKTKGREMHHQKKKSGMMGRAFHAHLDADDDGRVTPDEARMQLEKLLEENDVNDDGTLSIEEFETLHSRLIRETMVDRFQHLDADGDGRVTQEEMTAPAKKMERMQKMHGKQKKHGKMMEKKMGMRKHDGAAHGASDNN